MNETQLAYQPNTELVTLARRLLAPLFSPSLDKYRSLLKNTAFLIPFFYCLLFSNVASAGFLTSVLSDVSAMPSNTHAGYLSRGTSITIRPYAGFLAWNPDGKQIALGTAHSKVAIVDVQANEVIKTLDGGKSGGDGKSSYSPNGRFLASGEYHARIYDVATNQLLTTISNPFYSIGESVPSVPYRIESIVFLPNSRDVAVAYTLFKKIKIDQGYVGSAVALYDAESGRQVWFQYLHGEIGVPSVSTPLITDINGGHLIFGIQESTSITEDFKYRSSLLFLDTKTGNIVRSIDHVQTMVPTALAISRDGRFLATGTSTGTTTSRLNITTHHSVKLVNRDPVRIWDATTGKLIQQIPVTGHVTCLAFAPDEIHLVIGQANEPTRETILVANMKTSAVEQVIKTSFGIPSSMSFSSDGTHLAVAGGDQLLILDVRR